MNAECQAIDYRVVRTAIGLSQVLKLLGFEPTSVRGDQLRGGCLLPDCDGRGRVFSANVERNIWFCFACGRGGNQLDLWWRLQATSFYHSTEQLCHLTGIPVPRLGPIARHTPRSETG